jgi:hypothetical protein
MLGAGFCARSDLLWEERESEQKFAGSLGMAQRFKSAKSAAAAGALLGVAIMWIGFQVVTGRHTGILRTVNGAKQFLSEASSHPQNQKAKGQGSQRSVTLNWKASPTPGARYNVYRRDDSSSLTKVNGDPVASTSYTDAQVEAGRTYFYTTRAVNSSGTESTASNEVRVDVREP